MLKKNIEFLGGLDLDLRLISPLSVNANVQMTKPAGSVLELATAAIASMADKIYDNAGSTIFGILSAMASLVGRRRRLWHKK